MYIIAEFENEIGVATVREKWLTPLKKGTFWLLYKQPSHYVRALQSDEEVTESWGVYKIKRLFYETDDYDTARKKLKIVKDTSDLQTNDEDYGVGKRKRKLSKKLGISSDELDVDSSFNTRPLLPRGSKIRVLSTNSQVLSNNSQIQNESVNTPIQNLNHNQVSNESEFRKEIFTIHYQLKEQMQQILKLLKSSKSSVQFSLPKDFPVLLPVSTFEDLQRVEDYLTTKNLTSLITYLSTLGGKDITSTTNLLMKKVLTDEVASGYSFFGNRNGKRPFNDLRIKTAIVTAVKKTTNAPEKTIVDIIKVMSLK